MADRRVLTLAAIAVVAIPAAIVIGMAILHPQQGGQLTPPTGVQVNAQLAPGTNGTWGVVLVVPPGEQPAILESVMPAAEPVGLEIIDISMREISGSNPSIGTIRAYPPPGELVPVEGAVVAPAGMGPRSQLIIGIHFPGPGAGAIDGLLVRYSVGDEHYELLLDVAYEVTPLGWRSRQDLRGQATGAPGVSAPSGRRRLVIPNTNAPPSAPPVASTRCMPAVESCSLQ